MLAADAVAADRRIEVAEPGLARPGHLCALVSTKAWYHDPRGPVGLTTVMTGAPRGAANHAMQLDGVTRLPAGTVGVGSTAGFAPAGNVAVGGERVAYTGLTPTAFTGCTGGVRSHARGTAVTQATITLPEDTHRALPAGAVLAISSGPGAGQRKTVLHWDAATKTAVVAGVWAPLPDATSAFRLQVRGFLGTAAGATADTIALDPASALPSDLYAGQPVTITDGPGRHQARRIVAYEPATGVATVYRPWAPPPGPGSLYVIPAAVKGEVHRVMEVDGGAVELEHVLWDGYDVGREDVAVRFTAPVGA